MSEHAPLAPSAADIWGAPDGCPAYPRMAALYPEDEETPEAREGQAAHHYLSETLLGRPCAVGDLAPNGHPIMQEMVDCAMDLIGDVLGWRGYCEHRFVVEQRVYMPSVHPTDNWGTTDIGGADFRTKTLYVRDYKYGHKYVDAWENLQLVDYAIGLFRHFAIPEHIWHEWVVDAAIAQPRCYHKEGPFKPWRVSGARFLELADGLAHAARKASDPDAEYHTGEHCTYCPARYDCPALIAVGGVAMDLSRKGAPQELTPIRAGLYRKHIVDAINRLEALQSGVDAQIDAFIRSGQSVPFADREQGEGREFWTRPIEEIYILGDMFGKELRKPAALTPAQARKLGIDETVISAYSDRRKGEYKVVSVDDNRAAKAFK